MAAHLMVEAGGVTAPLTVDIRPGQPRVRWSSRATTLDGIQDELTKIWARPQGGAPVTPDGEQHVAARTSVLNLVVAVRRPEVGMRAASTIGQLTGRHPSRTLIISSVDSDGPSWLDAQIQALCVTPPSTSVETCAELVYLTAGGEAGRHLTSLIAPLLIHDLPVTLWVPGEPAFGTVLARELTDMADRLIVDGSRWAGNGLPRLAQMAMLAEGRLAISDFALMRQSRWREAIAATFDAPEFTPFLRSIRRITVTYATHDETGDPEATNVIKPVYHVAWVAGRLGMRVLTPVTPIRIGAKPQRQTVRDDVPSAAPEDPPGPPPVPGGFNARLRHGSADVAVALRPRLSGMPEGTTLRVELLAERRGSQFRADVTAEAETVRCRVWQDGAEVLERRFSSPRRVDVDLLAEAIESTGDDRIERETIRMAGMMVMPLSDGGEPL